MKTKLKLVLEKADSFNEAEKLLIAFLSDVRQTSGRVGYVAGLVASEGVEHVSKNYQYLSNFAQEIQKNHNIPVFSCGDIFGNGLFEKLCQNGIDHEAFKLYWRKVIQSELITDIFMAPGWERSGGATDEHETAKKLKIKIHYL